MPGTWEALDKSEGEAGEWLAKGQWPVVSGQ